MKNISYVTFLAMGHKKKYPNGKKSTCLHSAKFILHSLLMMSRFQRKLSNGKFVLFYLEKNI